MNIEERHGLKNKYSINNDKEKNVENDLNIKNEENNNNDLEIKNKRINKLQNTIQIINNLKKQIGILKPEDFELLKNPRISKSFLKYLILYLINLDTEISTYTTEPEILLSTPLDDQTDIHEIIKKFSIMFNLLLDNMENINIDYFLILYDKYIIYQQTKHIHFLLFKIAHNPKVYVYLLTNKKRISIPIFASLYSRYKNRNKKALEKFVLRMKNDDLNIHALMYILCFDRDSEFNKILIEKIKNKKTMFLNKRVVNFYNKIYNMKIEAYENEDEIFYYFPFDVPMIESIRLKIDDDYVHFIK